MMLTNAAMGRPIKGKVAGTMCLFLAGKVDCLLIHTNGDMNIVFSEHKPSAHLQAFIQAYWFGDFNISGSKAFAQSVVPNGCVELIVHLTPEHCALEKGKNDWHKSPDFTILGMHTKPYEVKFSARVNVFGIRFFPDGVRNIFGIPPSVFLSTYENCVDVLGQHLDDFCRRIRDSASVEQRPQLAEEFFHEQLQRHYRSYDYTHRAMKLIRSAGGQMIHRDVKERIPISERQLQREFRNQYGITAQEYMRLVRMNEVYNCMQSGPDNLTQVSNDLEFFDQSHFIREFRYYVGLPPGKFRKHREKFIVNAAVGDGSAEF